MIRKECLSTPVLLRSPSPWAGLPCSRFHPLVASRIAGSPGCSVRRPRQPHRRERRLRHAHVPSGSKARGTWDRRSRSRPAVQSIFGGYERAVPRVCAADVRCAGRLRSADSPALPRGTRPPLRTPTVGCVLRSPRSGAGCAPRNAQPLAPVHGTCSRPALIAVPAGRRSAVAAPYGMCGEITYSYRQLQTPGALRRLRKRSFGHGIRAPGPRSRHSVRTPRPATECPFCVHLPPAQNNSDDIDILKRKGRCQVYTKWAKAGISIVVAGEAQGSGEQD